MATSWAVNPLARVRQEASGADVAWVVDAPIPREGLRSTVVTPGSLPAAHWFFSALARGGDAPAAVDDATLAELGAVGFLVAAASVPRPVAFSVPLAAGDGPGPVDDAAGWVPNRDLRWIDLPGEPPLARGRAVVVGDPVRGVESTFWPDEALAATIEGLRSGTVSSDQVAAGEAEVLVEAGILVGPDHAEAAAAFERRLAVARASMLGTGYAALSGLFPERYVEAIRRYYREAIAEGLLRFGDAQTGRRYNAHNEALGMWLHARLAPLVQRVVTEPVRASYSYVAGYLSGADLPRHTDRAQCRFTLSYAVDFTGPAGAAPWPFCLECPQDEAVVQCLLEPGQAVLFRGCDLSHFRDPLPDGQTSTSLLFHFVPADFSGDLE